MLGLLEVLAVGFAFALLLSIVLAFVLFMVHMKRKEDAAVKQFGRLPDKE
jgi:hypothetical protein